MKTILFAVLSLSLIQMPGLAADTNLPTNLAELDRWYVQPPADQNAATIYLQAFAALKVTEADSNSVNLPFIGTGTLPAVGQPVPAAMQTAITEFVERNQPALDLFEKGATIQQSRYPVDLSQGMGALLPYLSHIKYAVMFTDVAALSHSLTGDGRQAGKDILTGLALGRSLRDEPILISQLVRIACTVITVNGLEQVVNRVSLPPGTLYQMEKSLKPLLEEDQAGTGLNRAMVGERLLVSSHLDVPFETELKILTASPAHQNDAETAAWLRTNSVAADRLFVHETFDQVLETLKEDYPQRLKAEEIFESRATEARESRLLISSTYLPGLSKSISRDAWALGELRLAQTGIALERFRSVNDGHYPNSLDELAPNYLAAVPMDPFDGQPLRYHKRARGYLLYSIGMDRKDDGGRRLEHGKGDNVFSVVNPPKAN